MLSSSDIRVMAKEAEERLRRFGDPHDGDDWATMQMARTLLSILPEDSGEVKAVMEVQRVEAARYRWLRSAGLNCIRWENLTPDTCDVGLDYAIDCAIREGEEQPFSSGE